MLVHCPIRDLGTDAVIPVYWVECCMPTVNPSGTRRRASQTLHPFRQRGIMMRYDSAMQNADIRLMVL